MGAVGLAVAPARGMHQVLVVGLGEADAQGEGLPGHGAGGLQFEATGDLPAVSGADLASCPADSTLALGVVEGLVDG